MQKRAAFALRLVAILELVSVARLLIIGVLRDRVLDELRSGRGGSDAVFAKLKTFSQISLWAHIGTGAAILIATVVLALALRHGRGWAFAAAGALAVHFVLLAIGRMVDVPREIPVWIKLVWWSDGASLGLGLLLPLVAAARAAPSALARLGIAGAALILLVDCGVSGFGFMSDKYPPMLLWLERGIAVANAAWFAGIAFPLARRLADGESGEPSAAPAVGVIDGTPLRTLGWAFLARIVSGIALQVLLVLAMMNGDYDSAGALTTLGTGISALISIVIFLALLQYLRFPTSHRGESLIVAMGLLVMGIGLELYAAVAANKLFGLAAEAKRATSFWGIPSLSEMESLQTTLTWAGRGGVVLGIAAGIAVMSSLRVTASALGATEHVARANRAMALLVTAAIGVVVVSVMTAALERDAVPILLLFAVALLFVAIVLVTNWMQLLFGLAKELEKPS